MQVSRVPGTNLACLRGEALPFEIELQGIDASTLEQLLKGRGVVCRWAGEVGRVTVAAMTPETPDSRAPFTHRFADGTTVLRSGCAAHVDLEANMQAPEYLLPPALNLALAQQWARLGLMALHAAAIKVADRQVLVLGPKASGKSTLCFAALVAGGEILSDDLLLLGLDGAGQPVGERLRQFMMVRDCWASEQLQQRGCGLEFQRSGARPKQVLPMDLRQQAFVPTLAINEIWVMARPRGGRTAISEKHPVRDEELLVQLIKAAMPLLFSTRFPLEHAALMTTAQGLIKACPAYRVHTGTDLVEQPAITLERLAVI